MDRTNPTLPARGSSRRSPGASNRQPDRRRAAGLSKLLFAMGRPQTIRCRPGSIARRTGCAVRRSLVWTSSRQSLFFFGRADADPAGRRPLRSHRRHCRPNDVRWDKAIKTLRSAADIEIAVPKWISPRASHMARAGARRLTDRGRSTKPIRRARSRIAQEAIAEGRGCCARTPLSRDRAHFAMPLKAAGIGDAKVVARFASEETKGDPSYIDHSRSYNEVLEDARTREGNR